MGINIPYGGEAAYRFDVSGSARFQEDVTIDGTLEVFNGDIKVSSSAQYTQGSDNFYGLISKE